MVDYSPNPVYTEVSVNSENVFRRFKIVICYHCEGLSHELLRQKLAFRVLRLGQSRFDWDLGFGVLLKEF